MPLAVGYGHSKLAIKGSKCAITPVDRWPCLLKHACVSRKTSGEDSTFRVMAHFECP
jgi:hypothetical protein